MKPNVNWRLLVLIVGALGLFSSSALAATGVDAETSAAAVAASPAGGKAQGPKEKGPKKQGPFVRVSGVVTNSLTVDGIAGAQVSFTAGETTFSAVTDAEGTYSEKLPVSVSGPYTISFEAQDYNSQSTDVVLVKGNPVTLNVELEPIAPVIVAATISGDSAPGATLTAMGTYKIMDGSTFVSSGWTQTESVEVVIVDPGADTTDVTLPGAGAFKAELIHLLTEPPITEDELPPNVEPPSGEFVGGLQDRFQVVGINHFALERAGHVALLFSVQTTSGLWTAEVDIHAALDWRVNPGLRNVPINLPVLLHGKEQSSYNWTLMSGPSAPALVDADTQNPEFIPDTAGTYAVMETMSGETLEIHAGTWRGVIVGQDADGLPVSDAACTGCHSGDFAPDNFTPWSMTGHAERFTTQLNGAFYSPSCFGCHTVGFDLGDGAVNDGFDDVGDYDGFLTSGLLGPNDPVACPDGDWQCMLDDFPANAQRANIQCENCHGPQNGPLGAFSTAHGGGVLQPDEARVGLSSDVCATCHGEPLRHARFQQWQLSRHSDYEVAIDEGDSGNCSRCHTANGFLTWLPVLSGDVAGDATASIFSCNDTTLLCEGGPNDGASCGDPGDPGEADGALCAWEPDERHPQTCVTCHDPHMAGTTSGNDTNANTRISGDTPLLVAGFQAFGVGKGAMCMTCHNTRRGLRNDSVDWATVTDKDRGPHGGVQADLIMGQNAYFVEVGNRGNHSFISDTCVNCHMKQTDPPELLAYNAGGANHTFFASRGVCIECHESGEPNADGVQAAVGGPLHALEGLIVDFYADLINDLLAGGSTLMLGDSGGGTAITSAAQIQGIHLSEFRGRQALTFDLDSATDVGPSRLTRIDINGGPAAGTDLFDQTNETVLKSTWNYLLVHTDRSGGVHNPAFSSLVLERAIAEMEGL